MAYNKHIWQNGQSGGTPINADRLNEMETGIERANETADDALGTANSASSVASNAADKSQQAVEKSTDAQATAGDALETANAATETANAASAAAAVADDKAEAAQATADGAQDAADAAQITADTALTIAQTGGGGGGGSPARYAHFRIPRGQVPANRDLATEWQLVDGEYTTPQIATNLGGCKLRIGEAGYYEFSLTVFSQGKSWTGGWMAVKDPAQTVIHASQDMPGGIGSWCISGAAYFTAGEEIFIQFHPAGSGDFLNVLLDFHITQISSLQPVVNMAKHAEAGYTYAQVHGSPWNAGLVYDSAASNDKDFVTWGTGNGLFTINETGIYSVDATVQSGAAIGGTLGLGNSGLTSWYAITDLGSAASSGSVSLSNVYLTAGTQLRYYYNGNSSANSANKTARVRITQIAAQPRAGMGEPRGLVGWSKRTSYDATTTGNVAGGGAAKPFLRLDLNLTPGRTYEVMTTPLRMGLSDGTNVRVVLSYREGDIATVYNRTLLTSEELRGKGHQDGDGVGPLRAILPVPLTADPKHSFLLEAVVIGSSSASNQAGFRPTEQWPAVISVSDIGEYIANHDVHPGPGPDDNPAWNPAN